MRRPLCARVPPQAQLRRLCFGMRQCGACFVQAGVADASRQLCPARGAGAWALTPFRALQNALGSVALSGGACGASYAPAPDLPEERGGWRWRGVWRLRHIRPLQFSKSAVLNTGKARGARCAPRVPPQAQLRRAEGVPLQKAQQ